VSEEKRRKRWGKLRTEFDSRQHALSIEYLHHSGDEINANVTGSARSTNSEAEEYKQNIGWKT
jgi:hypothetical protein